MKKILREMNISGGRRKMAKKQVEDIKKIRVEPHWVDGGHTWTKTVMLFESGKLYTTSILEIDRRFDKFTIGDKVLVTIAGDTVLQVKKT